MTHFNPPLSHIKTVVFLVSVLSIGAIVLTIRPTDAANLTKTTAASATSATSDGPTSIEASLMVNDASDAADTNVGDSICDTSPTAGDQCTLRAAIQEASAASGADTINFSLAANSTITLNTQLPAFIGNFSIVGPGASLLTIQRSSAAGTPIFQIFSFLPINGNFNNSVSGLTILNGNATGSFTSNMSGGGIFNFDACTLTLTDVVISGSTSTNGGGLYNAGTVTLTNSKVTGNNSPNGGGILNFGTLTIINTTVSGNSASNGAGGGIVNSGGTVSITGSTVSGNTCDAQGGGIVNKDGFNGAGSLTLTNSTVSGNNSTGILAGGVGAIFNNAGANTLTLINTTVTANTASGSGSGVAGIFNGSGSTANLRDSIVAKNTSDLMLHDLNGTFNSQGYNLIGESTGTDGFTNGSNGDQVGTYGSPLDPKLGVLTDNGGSTKTHPLLVGSPAIDAGNTALINDQRGQPRPVDDITATNAAGGNASDIGAYEAHTFQVNSTGDSTDGACTLVGTGNGCTLREAIERANAEFGSELITFAPALTAITLTTALPTLTSEMSIAGPGAGLLTVQRSAAGGTPRFRIFTNFASTVNISGLTISNGHTADGVADVQGDHGGGVSNSFGKTMNLTNVVVSGNATGNGGSGGGSSLGGYGGGIWNEGTMTVSNSSITGNRTGDGSGIAGVGGSGGGIENNGTLTITRSSISDNVTGDGLLAGGSGAGISTTQRITISGTTISDNRTGAPRAVGGGIKGAVEVNISNTTISGNQASSYAGGIFNFANATLTNVTVTNNQGGDLPGGGLFNDGNLTLRNTIVAGNFRGVSPGTTDDDISGNVDPGSSFNLIGTGGSGGLSNGVNNNQVGVANPRLGPLANNGGPTQTHAMLAGSPALDAANNTFIVNPPFSGPPFTDQRGTGFARIVDGPDADTTDTVDIGAFEAQVSVADIADQTINEDGSLSLPFNVGGAASITSVTATSSNTTLVPNNPTNISISGSGSSRTLVINPVANAFGGSTITVTVNDSNSQTMTDTFLLTVNPVNDVPSFNKGADQTVNENDGAQTVNNWATSLSAGPANESGQTLTFLVSNNTNPALFAVAPAISSTGTLTYTPAAGASGMATITIALMDNGGTSNGGVDTSATQTFNINVLEGGTLAFSSATYSGAENTASVVITVNRTGGTAGEARVNYATSNGTATFGQDYAAASGTLIFPDGITTQSFNVAITNDTLDEPDETINLTLSSPAGSGSLGTPANTVLTINDDDPIPGISVDNTAVNEGDSGTANATFTVTLSGPSSQTVTVNYATADGTATAGSDYLASNGTLTFLPLEITKPITVTVNGDIHFEPNETFFVNLSSAVNATIDESQGGAQITNDDAQGGFIAFSQSLYTVGESGGFTTITVNRTNDLSGAATVEYFTRDYTDSATIAPCITVSDFASSRCDYTSAFGTLRFAAGETSKTFLILISQDSFVESPESLSLTLTNATGGALFGSLSTATLTITDDATEPTTNPIDSADAFVRQHYHDFLNREPDAGGLAFWSNQITECQQPGATCNAEVRRVNVSAAFFLSIEFQETGYLVYRMYKAGYGNITGAPVPVRLTEFLSDTQQIGKGVTVGLPGWPEQLENNKVAFALDFVSRSRFTTAHPTNMSPAEFVDALFTNAGVVPSAADRDAAINEFAGASNTANTAERARALRRVGENSTLAHQEFRQAFVLMQYFGYLRRNPNDSPDSDYGGYEFWLDKLNDFNGNYIAAEMVKAFIDSIEYRRRFAP